jgi:hypothetical protein
MLVFTDCSNNNSLAEKEISGKSSSPKNVTEENLAYIKFKSFQNLDSTWGFTIFVNSRPFLHYKKVPVSKAERGFDSRNDAEIVAGHFVKLIREGNLKPSIDLKTLDTMGIILRRRKMPG